MDCLQLKQRRRRKERDQKKFRQLSPHNSPTHSQPSTLGHGGNNLNSGGAPAPPPPGHDPRLPKVGSNGLWMGTPGIYAGTPSPAYMYGRPGGVGGGKPHQYHPHHPHHHHHSLMQPAVMQRASSETRLPQRSSQGQGYHPRHHLYHVSSNRRTTSLQRLDRVHQPYVSGGSGQRIYHSQQLQGLTPVYELMDPRNGSIYDVYQIGAGGSRTKLLDNGGGSAGRSGHHHHDNHHHDNHHHDNHRHHSRDRQSSKERSKKVERSQSDVQNRPGRRHSKGQERPNSETRPSKTEMLIRAGKSGEVKAQGGGLENRAYSHSIEKLGDTDKVPPVAVTSATDSMKLLAKNKTDDQKTVPDLELDLDLPSDLDQPSTSYKPSKTPSVQSRATVHQSNKTTTGGEVKKIAPPVPEKTSSLHYTYEGDVYAVPEKERGRRRGSDNPILARMQDIVLEREDGAEDEGEERRGLDSSRDPVTDIAETAEPLLIVPPEDRRSGQPPMVNPIYQEIDDVLSREDSNRSKHSDSSAYKDVVDAAKSAASSRHKDRHSGDDDALSDVAAASAVTSVKDAGASGVDDRPIHKDFLEPRLSIDTDGATGKHISEAEQAFDFLDNYLSDEDYGADIHSPPQSPVLSERDMMY